MGGGGFENSIRMDTKDERQQFAQVWFATMLVCVTPELYDKDRRKGI